LRRQLAAWEQNAAQLQPRLESIPLLAENAPLAAAIVALCRAGQEAVSYRSAAPPAGWKPRTLAALQDAGAHRADMLIAIAPAVEKLVQSVP
jgi:hypothetical protein